MYEEVIHVTNVSMFLISYVKAQSKTGIRYGDFIKDCLGVSTK